MNTGDIVFFKSQSWIGKIIAKITGSPYTHVALVVYGDTILEADRFIKVRLREIHEEEVYLVKRYKGGLDIQDQQTLQTSGILMVGNVKYDYLHVAIWFMRLVFGWKGDFVDRSNRVYCTEMIDDLYQSIGIDLVPNRLTGDVLPSHLLNSPLLEGAYTTEGRE